MSSNPFVPLVEVTDVDRGRAMELAETGDRALERGDADVALTAFLMAAATDPGLEPRAARAWSIALALAPDGAAAPGPDPLDGAAELVVLADVYELIDNPQLLSRLRPRDARRARRDAGHRRQRPRAGSAWRRSSRQAEVPDSVDLLAIPGPLDRFSPRPAVVRRSRARLTEDAERAASGPRYGAAQVEALRVVATAAR